MVWGLHALYRFCGAYKYPVMILKALFIGRFLDDTTQWGQLNMLQVETRAEGVYKLKYL